METTHEMPRMGMKRILAIENNYGDSIKLEPRVSERTEKIRRKNSSSVFKIEERRRETPP